MSVLVNGKSKPGSSKPQDSSEQQEIPTYVNQQLYNQQPYTNQQTFTFQTEQPLYQRYNYGLIQRIHEAHLPIVEQVLRVFDEKALFTALQQTVNTEEDRILLRMIAIRLAFHYKNVEAAMWLARYEIKANNMTMARDWFKVAADAGNAEAIKALEAYDTIDKI